jgi:hypothetical protein
VGRWPIFVNPFIRGVRFSLATGLRVIAAHERRHLWRARNVRHVIEIKSARSVVAQGSTDSEQRS